MRYLKRKIWKVTVAEGRDVRTRAINVGDGKPHHVVLDGGEATTVPAILSLRGTISYHTSVLDPNHYYVQKAHSPSQPPLSIKENISFDLPTFTLKASVPFLSLGTYIHRHKTRFPTE